MSLVKLEKSGTMNWCRNALDINTIFGEMTLFERQNELFRIDFFFVGYRYHFGSTYDLNVSRFNFCVSGVPPSEFENRWTFRRFSIISFIRKSFIRMPDVRRACFRNTQRQKKKHCQCWNSNGWIQKLTAKNLPIGSKSVASLRNISNRTSSAFFASLSRWLNLEEEKQRNENPVYLKKKKDFKVDIKQTCP